MQNYKVHNIPWISPYGMSNPTRIARLIDMQTVMTCTRNYYNKLFRTLGKSK
ncbi:hypothetical protein MtrunA17_Chr7g0243341 [Medicago truncatula]|uniref:Uncharacterized protein n=1 Tax=Medicago truncatula TaxID=3880 RepID=A0A396H1E6_MEDTR|nr:hypothetical protein MtrunA17_Chr7g0243341 [Medicago truncatula]